jgi:HAD superfamily hydrolase (TIGR01549 family)
MMASYMNALFTRPLSAVIFDMDGTLIDSKATVPAAYAATIFELSGRRCTDAEIIAAYGAGPAGELIGQFIGRPATDDDVDLWHRQLEARLGDTTVYPGVADALHALRVAGVKLAVFTGATARAAQLQLQRANELGPFDAIVGSDEIKRVKPSPDGVLRACELLDVEPSRAAYIGDATNDVLCARAAGALGVAAGWGHLFMPGMEADVVATTPADLARLVT